MFDRLHNRKGVKMDKTVSVCAGFGCVVDLTNEHVRMMRTSQSCNSDLCVKRMENLIGIPQDPLKLMCASKYESCGISICIER